MDTESDTQDEHDSVHERSEFEDEAASSAIEEESDASVNKGRSKRKKKKTKKSKRASMEDQIYRLSTSVLNLENMIKERGLLVSDDNDKRHCHRSSEKGKSTQQFSDGLESEATIYKNAVEFVENDDEMKDPEISFNYKNRDSTSSEEKVNTSDEFMEVDVNERFIAECAREAANSKSRLLRDEEGCNEGTSSHDQTRERQISRSDQFIREVEASKARMIKTPGELTNHSVFNAKELEVIQHSVVVDENYMVVGAHLDRNLQSKIINSEYVDFSKLISRDQIGREDENRNELVSRGGSTFFVPVADRLIGGGINNFSKWEQAFRIFANVYTKVFPHKASELIQYNHTIYTAAQNFSWENVYAYDKEFRIHISNFPQRCWSVILQQAWTMCLKDRVHRFDDGNRGNGGNGGKKHWREACK